MICDPRFHCGRHARCRVNAAKVVMHLENRQSVGVILDLLRESVSEPRKSAHVHRHRENLPLDVACRDVLHVGLALNVFAFAADALAWAVTRLLLDRAINLNQHRIVDPATESPLDRFEVDFQAVRPDWAASLPLNSTSNPWVVWVYFFLQRPFTPLPILSEFLPSDLDGCYPPAVYLTTPKSLRPQTIQSTEEYI